VEVGTEPDVPDALEEEEEEEEEENEGQEDDMKDDTDDEVYQRSWINICGHRCCLSVYLCTGCFKKLTDMKNSADIHIFWVKNLFYHPCFVPKDF